MTLNCEIVVQIIVLYEPSVIKFEVLFLYQNTLCNNIVMFSPLLLGYIGYRFSISILLGLVSFLLPRVLS